MSKNVECFFCGEAFPSQITKGKDGFTCPSCDNYNGFSPDTSTGYNRTIPEMYDRSLNAHDFYAREGDYDLPNRVFYDPFEFCPTCERAQNRNPSQFRTCPTCRLKVVSHLRRLDDKTENLYGSPDYENVVQQSPRSSRNRKKRRKYPRKEYGMMQKFSSRILHYCTIVLVPIQVIYLCLLNFKIVVGSDFEWWENILWKTLILAIVPLFFRGFLFPFTMIVIVGWIPRFVSWVCVDKRIWCGGNEELLALGLSFFLTMFKIIKDEVKRVRVCSQLKTEHERRQCYLYSNLFNEEDFKKEDNSIIGNIKRTGDVNMKKIKNVQKKSNLEKKKMKLQRYLTREANADSILLPRKKRSFLGSIFRVLFGSVYVRSLLVLFVSLGICFFGLRMLETFLDSNIWGVKEKLKQLTS